MAAAKLLHKAGGEVKVPTYLVPATQKVRLVAGGAAYGQARVPGSSMCHSNPSHTHLPCSSACCCVPATPAQVWADVYTLPVPGCDGKTAAQIFEAAGCVTPAAPSCAACLGGPRDTFARMNEPEVRGGTGAPTSCLHTPSWSLVLPSTLLCWQPAILPP